MNALKKASDLRGDTRRCPTAGLAPAPLSSPPDLGPAAVSRARQRPSIGQHLHGRRPLLAEDREQAGGQAGGQTWGSQPRPAAAVCRAVRRQLPTGFLTDRPKYFSASGTSVVTPLGLGANETLSTTVRTPPPQTPSSLRPQSCRAHSWRGKPRAQLLRSQAGLRTWGPPQRCGRKPSL